MKRPRHRNSGLRKRCGCPRKNWPKCAHGWHVNFKTPSGPHYRISLDRELGRHIESKIEAIAEAERIRIAIRSGAFRAAPAIAAPVAPALTFRMFAEMWQTQRGNQLVKTARQ